MMTQRQLLDRALGRCGLKTYRELAEKLGVSGSALSQFKYGTPIGDTTAIKLAELCGLDAAYVLICIVHNHKARMDEHSPALPVLKKLAESVR